jgi:signal recognition particle receptor subunit beta
MVFFNYSTMQMAAKVVYYGPGLCGKTTNLQWIFDHTSTDSRGEMVSLATETDRTLFFDLLPIDVGTIAGFNTRIQLYTVPGQVFYNTTRKLVLKGVDGVVFVADSQAPMVQANIDSFANLEENLAEMGLSLETIPVVLQFNKRDLPNVLSVEELNKALNRGDWPFSEAAAIKGEGVFETLKMVSKATLLALKRRLTKGRAESPRPGAAPAPRPALPKAPLKPPLPPRPALAKPTAEGDDAARAAAPRPLGAPLPRPSLPKPPPRPAAESPAAEAPVRAAPATPAPGFEAPAVEALSEPDSDFFASDFPETPVELEPVEAVALDEAEEPPELLVLEDLAEPQPAELELLPAAGDPAAGEPEPIFQIELEPSFELDSAEPIEAAPEPLTVEPEMDVVPVVPSPAEPLEPAHPGAAPPAEPKAPAWPLSAPPAAAPRAPLPPPAAARPAAASPWPVAPPAPQRPATTSPPRARKPRLGGIDALAELEKLRREALHPRSARRQAKNGQEIRREVRLDLARNELHRIRRFALTLQLEDRDRQLLDEVRQVVVDVDDAASLEQLVLRFNIALTAKET